MVRIGFPKGNLLSRSQEAIAKIVDGKTGGGILSFGEVTGSFTLSY